MAQQVTVARPIPQQPRHSPWPGRFLLGLALLIVATILASAIFTMVTNVSSPAPVQPIIVQTNPVVVPAPAADVPSPPIQSVMPAVPTTFTPQWVEMGKVYNGDQVRALPIQWDRMVKFSYEQSDGKELGIALPPATAQTNMPLSRLGGYVPIDNGQVILYAYSNYHWSVEDPQGVTYWKDVVPASVVERLSP
ncbi:MAG: hypothetical protein Q7S62_01120 [bacterium]|nr:hypothetical protein [bacterium]